MKKRFMMSVLFGMALQSAVAAPIGWYDLNATWRDGSFSGKFYYDSTTASRITQVDGVLHDSAQTTAITSVFNPEDPEPWTFLSNARPANDVLQDAGFYLNLMDLGDVLRLDTALDNGLYDWSSDFAFYAPDQLDDSPLLSYQIFQSAPEPGAPKPVPEPDALALLALGLPAIAATRRRKRK